jgi:uncharacterized protein YkwD
MTRLPKSRHLLLILIIPSVFILFFFHQYTGLGWAPASTPQSYLPVMLKPATPSPTITATPNPTPAVTPTPTGTTIPPPDWLSYLNWLRSLGGLPALTENPAWSNGDMLHAQYMVKNDYIGHSEDPDNEWYTPEGAAAAVNSNAMVNTNAATPDTDAIDLWMSGPFHALGIIDPALAITGFGSYREEDGGWQMGACLDVLRGLESIPPSVTFPLLWPGEGSIMPYVEFTGGEWPDPLASCPGYTAPSGPPILIQVGSGDQIPLVTAHSFQQAGTQLDHCIFDETNYANGDPGAQSTGRSVMGMRNAIVLMPKERLEPGLTYTVSVTNNGTAYTWSFTVSESPILSSPSAEIR